MTSEECRAASVQRRADSQHRPLEDKDQRELQGLIGQFVLAPRAQLGKQEAVLKALPLKVLKERARASEGIDQGQVDAALGGKAKAKAALIGLLLAPEKKLIYGKLPEEWSKIADTARSLARKVPGLRIRPWPLAPVVAASTSPAPGWTRDVRGARQVAPRTP